MSLGCQRRRSAHGAAARSVLAPAIAVADAAPARRPARLGACGRNSAAATASATWVRVRAERHRSRVGQRRPVVDLVHHDRSEAHADPLFEHLGGLEQLVDRRRLRHA